MAAASTATGDLICGFAGPQGGDMVRVDPDRSIGAELREPGETRLAGASCIREPLLGLLHGPVDGERVTVQKPDLGAAHREPW